MAGYLRVKICGVTSVADAQMAVEAGADALGLNFHPGSPRCVDMDLARQIARSVPPFVEVVGVFVDRPRGEACALLRALGRAHTVQMHGEPREVLDCWPFSCVPAFPVRDESSLRVIEGYLAAWLREGWRPEALLVDGHQQGLHGGTGRTAPWELLATFRPGVPLILAGGLTPENVAEAVQVVRPYAVDVASGVELAPGRKDAEKVRRFIENARAGARPC
jgi:phosphoribosylanthranilate isomerase